MDVGSHLAWHALIRVFSSSDTERKLYRTLKIAQCSITVKDKW
jgi:hypothetical protein